MTQNRSTRSILLSRRHLMAAGVAAFSARPTAAADAGRGLPVRAVLELFTSQSCSSCPPADALFVTLAREADTLALTQPVTIWDHLGWKDTLAQARFSDRQKGYCRTRGDRNVYTPQAVVNGVRHVVGSDLNAIDAARKDSAGRDGVMAVQPALELVNGRWQLRVPSGERSGQIVLISFERSRVVRIGKGENSGRMNRYANVVDAISWLQPYTGVAVVLDLPTGLTASASHGFAVLVQAGSEAEPGAILGAVEAPRA